MSHVYVEQNQAQNLNIFKETILNSKSSEISIETPAKKNNEGLIKTVDLWVQRSRQRKQLSQLDNHLLDDLGLTKEMVKKEVAKPFWK